MFERPHEGLVERLWLADGESCGSASESRLSTETELRLGQQIETCTVDRSAVAALKQRALVMPWSLEDRSYALDDEFARQLGGAALLLLAIDQPELKQYVTVSQQSESPPTE
jgi:hypothetical protein